MSFTRQRLRSGKSGAPAPLRPVPARHGPVDRSLELQRAAGNHAMAALLLQSRLQRQATVSSPGDAHEREADEVADGVMRMTDSLAEEPSGHAEHVRRATSRGEDVPPENAEQAVQVAGRGGQPLPDGVRNFFEPRFDADLGQVRVHTDAEAAHAARAVDASAYTVGSDIVFGAGEYAPQTHAGQRLLAHELTHVAQQSGLARRSQEVDRQGSPDAGAAATPRTTAAPTTTTATASSAAGAGAPIQVSGEAQGERFLYVVNTANFRPGEEQRLRAFAKIVPDEGTVEIHGFASEEGPPDLNQSLSSQRALKAQEILVDAGLAQSRLSRLYAHGATPGARPAHRSAVIDLKFKTKPPAPAALDAGSTSALGHLQRLATLASSESGGADFQKAVEDFRKQLKADLEAVPASQTLPDDLRIVIKALLLWDVDTGDQWGEGRLDSKDFTPSAAAYAVVPAAQNKCNAFLAEVIVQATGLVHQGHLKEGMAPTDKRAWFPYRASEWGDAGFTIPHFPVVKSPVRGDILCTGGHVGIYLGNYAGKDLYVSARDDAMGVLGIGEQFTHGIQIKYTKAGIYRRFQP